MQIADRTIGGNEAFILAELGHNHGGDVTVAEQMIRMAAWAGADAVKLQRRTNQKLYTKAFYDQPYTSENSFGATYGAHREALELDGDDYKRLLKVADDEGVLLFATAFDPDAVDFCMELGLPAIKIASGDLTNTPLIAYAAKQNVPLILSTGGGTVADIDRALESIRDARDRPFVSNLTDVGILQCTASYPCRYEELDLGFIQTMKARWPYQMVGASVHANGISAPLMAYCMGARILEVHFTLDRTSKGTDHAFSLEPQGLRKLVRDVRRAEVALGMEKRQHESETTPLGKMRKVVVAARRIRVGEYFSLDNLACKSPAAPEGIPPFRIGELVGKRCTKELELDDLIPASRLGDA